MYIKKVKIIGKETTSKTSRLGFPYYRYYASSPIPEDKGVGFSCFSFSSTIELLCGDEANIAYTLKKTSDGNTFSTWELLNI